MKLSEFIGESKIEKSEHDEAIVKWSTTVEYNMEPSLPKWIRASVKSTLMILIAPFVYAWKFSVFCINLFRKKKISTTKIILNHCERMEKKYPAKRSLRYYQLKEELKAKVN